MAFPWRLQSLYIVVSSCRGIIIATLCVYITQFWKRRACLTRLRRRRKKSSCWQSTNSLVSIRVVYMYRRSILIPSASRKTVSNYLQAHFSSPFDGLTISRLYARPIGIYKQSMTSLRVFWWPRVIQGPIHLQSSLCDSVGFYELLASCVARRIAVSLRRRRTNRFHSHQQKLAGGSFFTFFFISSHFWLEVNCLCEAPLSDRRPAGRRRRRKGMKNEDKRLFQHEKGGRPHPSAKEQQAKLPIPLVKLKQTNELGRRANKQGLNENWFEFVIDVLFTF